MNINRSYVSKKNTHTGNNPQWIVIHNTDNFSAGANALAHAKAQSQGNLSGMSAHYYVDDGGTVYQAADHSEGCWHVGKNYGGNNLFGTVNNRNSIGIEMCVQAGYNYEKAFQATVELTRYLMSELGLGADRVVRHYDVCSKNCPSQIQARGDWKRFKAALSGGAVAPAQPTGDTYIVQSGDTLSKIAKMWDVSVSDLVAANAIADPDKINVGQSIHKPAGSGAGSDPAPQPSGNPIVRDGQIHLNNYVNAMLALDGLRGALTIKAGIMALQQAMNMDYGAGLKIDGIWGQRSDAALGNHYVCLGECQEMVRALQILLMIHGYDPHGVDGSFGTGTEAALRQYQTDHGLAVDGVAGHNTFKNLVA